MHDTVTKPSNNSHQRDALGLGPGRALLPWLNRLHTTRRCASQTVPDRTKTSSHLLAAQHAAPPRGTSILTIALWHRRVLGSINRGSLPSTRPPVDLVALPNPHTRFTRGEAGLKTAR